MERVLIVCGGEHQIPLIKKTRELGYYAINTNLYEDSPGFKYSNESGVFDVLDMKGNLEFARAHNINAVITDQSEISVRTTAYVSNELGLPSISPEIAKLFTDKYKMRQFCQKNGFPFPAYTVCYTIEDAIDFINKNPGKSILKPTTSHSSRGVFTVYNKDDVKMCFDEAKGFSQDDAVIIERYIEGTEFTIDAIVDHGMVYNLAISEKSHYAYNENVANSLLFSFDNEEYNYDLLRSVNTAILKKSRIPFGLTHSEYKYSNGQFYLIEMAARGGGVYIASRIVPFVSGVDNYGIYIENALGHELEGIDVKINGAINRNRERIAKLCFFDFKANGQKVKRIIGEDVFLNKNILKYELKLKEGDVLYEASDDSSRVGYYIIGARSCKELNDIERSIHDGFKVIMEE